MNLFRNNTWTVCLLATATLLAFVASPAFAFSSFKTQFNNRYGTAGSTIDSCSLCHPGGSSSAPAVNSYGQAWINNGMNSAAFAAIEGLDSDGDSFTNIDEITARTFPGDSSSKPVIIGPVCTDNDNDGFAVEGGTCGPIDCNDNNPAIKPNAVESCTDSIDNNCNGLIDRADPQAVSCPPLCTDNDNDGYAIQGGACGPVDCNDNSAAVNPGAVENCTDQIDNNCNSLVDRADPNAQNCPIVVPPTPTCTDADNDGFNAEGNTCGPVDCNDANPLVNPTATENCTDGIDNNCNNLIDATDPNAQACPAGCTDADQDGYALEGGTCGPVDCNDTNRNTNPASVENCADGIDNDCDSLIDKADPNAQSCPVVCTDADRDGYAVEGGVCGPVDPNDSNASIVPGGGKVDGDDDGDDGDSDEDRPVLNKDQQKQVTKYQKQLAKLEKSMAREKNNLQKVQGKIANYEAQLQVAQSNLAAINSDTASLTKEQQKLANKYQKQIIKLQKSLTKEQKNQQKTQDKIASYEVQIQTTEDHLGNI